MIALPNVKKARIIRDIDSPEYLEEYIEATVVTTKIYLLRVNK